VETRAAQRAKETTAALPLDRGAGPQTAETSAGPRPGLRFEPYFSTDGVHPYDQLEWEKRTATIASEKGEVFFEQEGVEFPKTWSQLATNVVTSKYFRGKLGTPERETSLRQLIDRVVDTLTAWGLEQGVFSRKVDGRVFGRELQWLLVNQAASFNSPVWFNVGVETHPQCSACFINSVEDSMESILGLARTEGMLFKFGSGTGTNFSSLRGSNETVAGGGAASGPVSFMKGYDAFAGVIKSGGKTRRAAKMVILDVDHPDIVEFIDCKAEEEKKAWALIDAGYDGTFTGEAYSSVFFQNSNNSVRVPDEFMKAVVDDGEWVTRDRTTGESSKTHRARDLMIKIAEAAHVCGDPGMQFDTTVNDWHTCANTDRINASNPCSEYMFLDDTACNLASLNLMKFVSGDGEFDVERFCRAVDILIAAQEIIVDRSSYPTPAITRNSRDYRPLGLGYANLGALLMSQGLPYDSDAGRDYSAAITALMTGRAYRQSAVMAEYMGSFPGFERNREPMLRVVEKHRSALDNVNRLSVPPELFKAAQDAWDAARRLGKEVGYRNAQVTVIAPTGTIGFMMDCDTTGIEPDIALVKYKKLVGGGVLKIVNNTVPRALRRLGYNEDQVSDIVTHIDDHETIEGASHLDEKHLPVFDCAFKPLNGTRSIHYMGHIKMMAATQPFLSGAISKTVNMPEDATPEDIAETYIEAWRQGLKAIAIYRDGSKRLQPLVTGKEEKAARKGTAEERRPQRRRLPTERKAVTHKFDIAGHEGYITVGVYEDGKPGEIFIVMSKEGTVVSGLMDSFATAISLALQYGVPLQVLVDKFSHTRFEPSGFTKNKDIPIAKSVMDYIFRWLSLKFLDREEVAPEAILREMSWEEPPPETAETEEGREGNGRDASIIDARRLFKLQEDAPPCPTCGTIMIRNASCYRCFNCGGSSGCS
jgi:ribonucleoside-diphosphate reductase alpha chain